MWYSTKNIGICIFFIVLSQMISGQDFKIYHKVTNDTLMISWVDRNSENFTKTRFAGYEVMISSKSGNTIFNKTVLPFPERFISRSERDDEFLLRTVLESNNLVETIFGSRQDPNVDEIEYLETIYELFYFTAAKKNEFLENAGLALSIPIDLDEEYNIAISPQISQTPNPTFIKTVVPSQYEAPIVPELKAKWEDRNVSLTWSHTGMVSTFNFYDLFISTDSIRWTKSDSTIVNFYGDEDGSESQKIEIKKDLENDVRYWFRLYGVDFLGERSNHYTEVQGFCGDAVKVSPYITKVDQLRSNKAHIRWDIPDDSKSFVEEYRIYVAEKYDGPYFLDTTGLSPNIFEIKREIPFRSAYFRVAAVDKNEKEYSSFPQIVISVDTLAPAVPSDLTYTIDTNGILDIKWNPNDEEDFIGYKLFYCYDTTVDMTLAHKSYLTEPSFKDTIELRSTNKEVFFQAISVDRRNNRSEFSELLVVTKPDILAPIEPAFISSEAGPGEARLKWYSSISPDVKEQRLFRRRIGNDLAWQLIELWDLGLDTTYIDTGLEGFEKYAYTITVIDSSGNESDPSIPVIVMPMPDYREVDFDQWTLNLEGNKALFRHEFNNESISKILLFRKIEDEALYSIAELDLADYVHIDEGLSKGKTYSYAIKVVFKEGIESPLSAYKTISR